MAPSTGRLRRLPTTALLALTLASMFACAPRFPTGGSVEVVEVESIPVTESLTRYPDAAPRPAFGEDGRLRLASDEWDPASFLPCDAAEPEDAQARRILADPLLFLGDCTPGRPDERNRWLFRVAPSGRAVWTHRLSDSASFVFPASTGVVIHDLREKLIQILSVDSGEVVYDKQPQLPLRWKSPTAAAYDPSRRAVFHTIHDKNGLYRTNLETGETERLARLPAGMFVKLRVTAMDLTDDRRFLVISASNDVTRVNAWAGFAIFDLVEQECIFQHDVQPFRPRTLVVGREGNIGFLSVESDRYRLDHYRIVGP